MTIATYDTMPDAHIALGRLKAEGVKGNLADEHLVQADWLYAIAVGGIKLRVAASDAGRAQTILATDYSGELE